MFSVLGELNQINKKITKPLMIKWQKIQRDKREIQPANKWKNGGTPEITKET